jgi:hypothetical protein
MLAAKTKIVCKLLLIHFAAFGDAFWDTRNGEMIVEALSVEGHCDLIFFCLKSLGTDLLRPGYLTSLSAPPSESYLVPYLWSHLSTRCLCRSGKSP